MQEGQQQVQCSVCGGQGPREDMFGAEPDLLCERCADVVRERTARTPTGRVMNSFVGGATPVTAAVLGIAAALFLVDLVVAKPNADFSQYREWHATWIWLLNPWGPTGSIGSGQAWRLLSSALLHGGWLHIIFNSIWIWALGRAVESTKGSLFFGLVFVGSAVFSSGLQWYFVARPVFAFSETEILWAGGGVGLSGVLYALAGFLWMRRKIDAVAASVLNPYTARMLGMWFVICILIPSLNVANWAHGGGLLWGLAAGWASTQAKPAPWYAALGAVTLAVVWWVSTGHLIR